MTQQCTGYACLSMVPVPVPVPIPTFLSRSSTRKAHRIIQTRVRLRSGLVTDPGGFPHYEAQQPGIPKINLQRPTKDSASSWPPDVATAICNRCGDNNDIENIPRYTRRQILKAPILSTSSKGDIPIFWRMNPICEVLGWL